MELAVIDLKRPEDSDKLAYVIWHFFATKKLLKLGENN